MAVMSFAHIKKSQSVARITRPTSASVVSDPTHGVAPASTSKKVMSFAGMKKRPEVVAASPGPPAEKVVDLTPDQPKIRLQRPKGIGAQKTALLTSTNYCAGCPRFWPSDAAERQMGVAYGRCCRSADDEDVEVWRIIPLSARVGQCWYHLQG